MSTFTIMTKLYIRKPELISTSSINLPRKKSITKIESPRAILIAIPNSVEFRNYKSNKLYQKIVLLRNVSTSLARFQLGPRPSNSRFTVMIEHKGQRRNIPPGMHAKLIISFRCDIFDEPEEILTINVQKGCSVIVKLRGYRDPPILRAFSIPYFRYPQESHVKETERFMQLSFQQSSSCMEFVDVISDASCTSTESLPHCGKLKSFDCGACFVGEQVTLSLMVKNIGGDGRFFIMSEIDWCSMQIEDVTDKNMLILTSFAVWPVYFTLKSQEYIYLYIYFFPDTHGVHVETLYAICDNCSVITTEIIGDGVLYE